MVVATSLMVTPAILPVSVLVPEVTARPLMRARASAAKTTGLPVWSESMPMPALFWGSNTNFSKAASSDWMRKPAVVPVLLLRSSSLSLLPSLNMVASTPALAVLILAVMAATVSVAVITMLTSPETVPLAPRPVAVSAALAVVANTMSLPLADDSATAPVMAS